MVKVGACLYKRFLKNTRALQEEGEGFSFFVSELRDALLILVLFIYGIIWIFLIYYDKSIFIIFNSIN